MMHRFYQTCNKAKRKFLTTWCLLLLYVTFFILIQTDENDNKF